MVDAHSWLGLAGGSGGPVRLARLRRLLHHAATHSPWYQERFRDAGLRVSDLQNFSDLQKLPVLSKDELRAHVSELCTRPAASAGLRTRRTTGTSGQPLQLPVTRAEAWFDLVAWQRLYQACGLRPWHRQVKIMVPQAKAPAQTQRGSPGLFRRQYLSTMLEPDQKIAELRRLTPDAVFAHASVLGEIARRLEDRAETLSVPRLFSTSDMLWPGLRALITRRLGGEIYDVYGSVETGPVAGECARHDGFHVLDHLVHVEIVDDAGRPATCGRMVCTVFWRRAVPLIRYAIGDWAEWAEAPCPCGDARPRLARLHGREHDLLRLSDGTWVTSSNLSSVLIGIGGIRQFQIVQISAGAVRYELEVSADYPPEAQARMRENFHRRFQRRLLADFVVVPSIVQDPRRKFSPFVPLGATAGPAPQKEGSHAG